MYMAFLLVALFRGGANRLFRPPTPWFEFQHAGGQGGLDVAHRMRAGLNILIAAPLRDVIDIDVAGSLPRRHQLQQQRVKAVAAPGGERM
jgi:hypothetical protein